MNKIVFNHDGSGEMDAINFELIGILDSLKVLEEYSVDTLCDFLKNGHPAIVMQHKPSFILSTNPEKAKTDIPSYERNAIPLGIYIATKAVNPGNDRAALKSEEYINDYKAKYPFVTSHHRKR